MVNPPTVISTESYRPTGVGTPPWRAPRLRLDAVTAERARPRGFHTAGGVEDPEPVGPRDLVLTHPTPDLDP